MQTKVPFMFRLPEFKDKFLENKFPGDFEELVKKFRPLGIVKELSKTQVKKVCVLLAMDQSGICTLRTLASDDPNAPPPVIFQVKMFTLYYLRNIKAKSSQWQKKESHFMRTQLISLKH